MTLISRKSNVNGSIILTDSKLPLCYRVAIEDSVAPKSVGSNKPDSLDKMWLPAHIFFHLISAKIHKVTVDFGGDATSWLEKHKTGPKPIFTIKEWKGVMCNMTTGQRVSLVTIIY